MKFEKVLLSTEKVLTWLAPPWSGTGVQLLVESLGGRFDEQIDFYLIFFIGSNTQGNQRVKPIFELF